MDNLDPMNNLNKLSGRELGEKLLKSVQEMQDEKKARVTQITPEKIAEFMPTKNLIQAQKPESMGVVLDGDTCKNLRKKQGKTLTKLSDLSGISVRAIGKAEKGCRVSIFTWKTLANALGVPPCTLLADLDSFAVQVRLDLTINQVTSNQLETIEALINGLADMGSNGINDLRKN